MMNRKLKDIETIAAPEVLVRISNTTPRKGRRNGKSYEIALEVIDLLFAGHAVVVQDVKPKDSGSSGTLRSAAMAERILDLMFAWPLIHDTDQIKRFNVDRYVGLKLSDEKIESIKSGPEIHGDIENVWA